MKPKEFIQKFGLEKGWNPKVQESFIQSFTSELLAFLELNKAENNIKGFDNTVKVIRSKWDAISNKIPYGLPEKLWSYFYATVICKLREELCPKEMEQRRRMAEERRREREERHAWINEMNKWYNNWFNQSFERAALMFLLLNSVPSESFQYLGLPEDATGEQIKQRYREMSLKAHPDMGGSQEEFIKLTEHKNKCLKWAMRQ